MTSVRRPSRAHSSAAGSKPEGQQQPAAHRRLEAERQRQAEQHQRRPVAPSSSLATHNAIRDAIPSPDDTTTQRLASASMLSRKTLQWQSRTRRSADVKRSFAWQWLLTDLAARPMRAAIRPDMAGTTGAPGQGDSEEDTPGRSRRSVTSKTHRQRLSVCCVVGPCSCRAGSGPAGRCDGQMRAWPCGSSHRPYRFWKKSAAPIRVVIAPAVWSRSRSDDAAAQYQGHADQQCCHD
jgi:hypothetical protein